MPSKPQGSLASVLRPLAALTLLLSVATAPAATVHYVDPNSPNSSAPYTNWDTAARDIQSAVDVAVAGDAVLVTNGTYNSGGRVAQGSTLTNRVLVERPITLESVNGPEFTAIEGYQISSQDPQWRNGASAIRCVSLAAGAALYGFTVTKGATLAIGSGYPDEEGGGVRCLGQNSLVSNCVVTGNVAYQYGAGVYGGTVTDCLLVSNSAAYGGGAYYCTLARCTLIGNSASYGGGADGGTLYHCALIGNSGAQYGGGAYGATLTDCALTGNSGSTCGGGASYCTLTRCTLTDNTVDFYGGGAHRSTLSNCVLTRNSGWQGGGALISVLNNCTLTGNSASYGGGAVDCTLNNSIIYLNTAALADSNYSGGSLNYCCTAPQPSAGVGNITLDPQLASASHLSATSPCRGAGGTNYASGTDIDGEPWAPSPSIGCDEYYDGSVTGALSVIIVPSYTNLAVGFLADFTALIAGRTAASVWTFSDGSVVSNRPYASHAWSLPGKYPVTLTAYNESNPAGISATVTVRVATFPVHYVAADSATPSPPYTDWTTAATDIQSAVDVAAPGSLVLVSNGVYATGGRTISGGSTNRVAIDRAVAVRSLNGPGQTIIHGTRTPGTPHGDSTVRCAYLTNGASLTGFTLTGGDTPQGGGGVWCESASAVVSNCVLSGNSAGSDGGGAYQGTLYNCALTGNSTAASGGGARSATLNNCTVTGNSASGSAGGAASCTLNNCIAYFNTTEHASWLEANYSGGSLNFCCTEPQPSAGVGNMSLNPQLASTSHLSDSSPCRGAGSGSYASGTDLDGEPWASPPSIGCDEYWLGALIGPLTVSILPAPAVATADVPVDFTGVISGRPSTSAWNFGDGVVLSNQPYASHTWSGAGDYPVILTAYNQSNAGGVSATVTVHVVTRPVHYVAAGNATPLAPYTNWATAATDIQSAVDVAAPGALVLVSNGVYAAGGRAVYGAMPNRVAIDRAITIQSINGPAVTIIQGAHAPGATNGDGATRCAYLTNGAVLTGFTLTNGATRTAGDSGRERSAGGVWCEAASAVVSNCVLVGNSCGYFGGGVYGGTLSNCTLLANRATQNLGMGMGGEGGGAYSATLNNCLLVSNVAWYGGAAGYSTLINCALTNNSATNGGGSYYGTLNNCMLATNRASSSGGGAYSCTLNNCTLAGNMATQNGGGADSGTLNNCTLTGNSAPGGYYASSGGGGAHSAVLNSCTLAGNSSGQGGGVNNCTVNNSRLTNNSGGFGGGAFASTLNNCTLTGNSVVLGGGAGEAPGGGAYQSTLNNCTLVGNHAVNGGGTAFGTMNNCKFVGNSAGTGGGAYYGTLNNCTVTGNSAYQGGGTSTATQNNCIVYLNTATGSGPNYYTAVPGGNVSLNYCCTTPLPPSGVGNITNAPAFQDYVSGNLRLQGNSPCVNTGNNAYAPGSTDLDGRARIVSGTVDIGAYEYQGAAQGLFISWLQQYGLPTDGSADYVDSDGDHLNNWQEWSAGTDPTNALSVLRLLSAARSSAGLTVTWQSVSNRTYFLERSTNLSASPPFLTVATNIPGQPGTTAYLDTNALGPGPFFYRVGVQSADYQFQPPGSVISYAWLQQYGLPTDGSADFSDPDHDGLNNWQEWRAGTDPTKALSALRMLSAIPGGSGVAVSWQSAANRAYILQRATNLAAPLLFLTVQSNLAGNAGTTTYTDTNASSGSSCFYRVGVQ